MIGNIWQLLIYGPIHNLLTYLYVVTGNLGLSTFILIVVIRILMWPMVSKQYRDTKKIRAIQPRLDELKERFKDKPTELAKAQQEVYKESKYNPLGCFTNLLIQFPILIALYQSVLAFTKNGVTPATMPGLYPFVAEKLAALGQSSFATDLFGIKLLLPPGGAFSGGFFTMEALPYLLLLLILGISNLLPTLVSMKIMNTQAPKPKKTPNASGKSDTEAMQDAFTSSLNTSTLYVMPVMITLSMTPLPSIVSVYMIAQNIISTLQQLLVKYFHDVGLRKKLIAVLTEDYAVSTNDAQKYAEKLLKLSPSINFLADELGEFRKVKTTGVKVNEVSFDKVFAKKKDVISALFVFDQIAKTPEKTEEILKSYR